MTFKKQLHSFHIPVMGTAFTIDSPIRVGHYGISSVISIIDDELMEKMNAFYSDKFDLPYQEISKKVKGFRAERISSYLNLVDSIVKDKFTVFKEELAENKTALENYIAMLPGQSEIKQGLQELMESGKTAGEEFKNFLEENLSPGSVDVNIMSKIDKDNFEKKEQLPVEYNDAHAALKGFATSNLSSAIVLSAGMNPRLYSYFEGFDDFYPDAKGKLRKKIILKVSDYRSAFIQGNYFAKKGLWVSEYRIESGLNCGGHAFATDGHLMGPILEEFKEKKDSLVKSAFDLMNKALERKGKDTLKAAPNLNVTVQGGVGTAAEHDFLLDHYKVASVGWGSPFLLVPEATSVDMDTRKLLADAKEKDLYLSNISPLGVPFNTVRGTSNETLKNKRIAEDKAGSSCPKKYLALSKEYDEQGICSASKKFQDIKLKELEEERSELSSKTYEKKKHKITEKACLCVGLGNAALMENDLRIKGQAQGVAICPGPNMAYFSRTLSLKNMIGHIYGSTNVIKTNSRPHMFIKEFQVYMDYFKNELEDMRDGTIAPQLKKMNKFKNNLLKGITYYRDLLNNRKDCFKNDFEQITEALSGFETELNLLEVSIPEKSIA